MSPLAIIFIAEAAPGAGEFPWAWAGFGVFMTLLVAFVGLGYRAGWFLPKYRMPDADPMHDPLALKIFGPPEIAARSRRQAQVVPRYQLSRFRSDGFRVVRVAFGREFLIGSQCIYSAPRDDGTLEDQVLVARGRGSSLAMSFQEQVNELGRNLTEMVRTFSLNTKEVRSSRERFRERLRALKQRYGVLYEEYRQRRAAGEGFNTVVTQLTHIETTIKDLNKQLDEMK